MFDWFNKTFRRREYTVDQKTDLEKIGEDMNKVIPFPEVQPPKEEKPATTFYRIGVTSNNRVSFQMGYSEITMNKQGVDNLIKQLELFRDQLNDEDDE